MFDEFKSFMKSTYYWQDHSKYENWFRKTFERPRRKKRK